eukprot:3891048-Rhodomonas_salina.3
MVPPGLVNFPVFTGSIPRIKLNRCLAMSGPDEGCTATSLDSSSWLGIWRLGYNTWGKSRIYSDRIDGVDSGFPRSVYDKFWRETGRFLRAWYAVSGADAAHGGTR